MTLLCECCLSINAFVITVIVNLITNIRCWVLVFSEHCSFNAFLLFRNGVWWWCTRVIPKVSDLEILDNNIFHNLYISETYILYWLTSLLRIWRHCNWWRHRALNRHIFSVNESLESFIIVDSGHHHYQISDFKIVNSH